MNAARIFLVIIGATLVVSFAAALVVFNPAANAARTSQPSVGMGDLQAIEGRLAGSNPPAAGAGRDYAGMGDLRSYELESREQAASGSGSHYYSGIGDMRAYEFEQTAPAVGSHYYTGIGDMRSYEFEQALAAAGPLEISLSPAGMGDLHFWERQTWLKSLEEDRYISH